MSPVDPRPTAITPTLAQAAASAGAYAREARAQRTRIEYAKQWRAFSAWCDEHGLCELPAAPQALAMYLSSRADQGRKVATLAQALAAISETSLRATRRLAQTGWCVRPGKAFGAG